MQLLTLEEVLKALESVKIRNNRVIGSQVEQPVFAGTEMPTFQCASFDSMEPRVVGYVGNLRVVVDNYSVRQRMNPSKDFKRLQHPELVEKTNQWMREFFGLEYPIYHVNGSLVMHSKMVRELQDRLGRS